MTEEEVALALDHVARSRYPERDRVLLLLLTDGGLRPREIADMHWSMVAGEDGRIGDAMRLGLHAGGRSVSMGRRLKAAMHAYRRVAPKTESGFMFATERADRMSPGTVSMWFHRLLKDFDARPGGGTQADREDPEDEPDLNEGGAGMRSTNESPAVVEVAVDDRDEMVVEQPAEADRETVFACVRSALRNATRARNKLAIVSIDLDGFSRINTVFGEGLGDRVLGQSHARLSQVAGNTQNVLRLYGDKFVALLPDLASKADASVAVRRIWDSFHESMVCGGQNVRITASIGVSVYPDDGRDAETLLRHADAALHAAKSEGRDRFVFFSGLLTKTFSEELDLEGRMREALETDAFVLHYQPTVDAFTRRIVGAEALIRWEIPGGGLIPPNKFIPTAERSGFIGQLGRWVLESVCRQLRSWQEAKLPVVPISVNVCASQLKDPNFGSLIKWVLEENKIDPRLLAIELTESIFLDDTEYVIDSMRKLSTLGVHFSVDDFGTGYSSLRYLRQLPIHQLKIDQYFVRDLDEDRDSAAMVRAIVAMAQSMGMTVVAEGVEKEEQLTVLRAYQCQQAQGYLFHRPMRGDILAATVGQEAAQISRLFDRPPSARGVLPPDIV
tara:strand:+ start:26 stop:1870 length:1845 start_codon:yes stop_codon:yes gene_type:complete